MVLIKGRMISLMIFMDRVFNYKLSMIFGKTGWMPLTWMVRYPWRKVSPSPTLESWGLYPPSPTSKYHKWSNFPIELLLDI